MGAGVQAHGYGADGVVPLITDALGQPTVLGRDPAGKVALETTEQGGQTVFGYDAMYRNNRAVSGTALLRPQDIRVLRLDARRGEPKPEGLPLTRSHVRAGGGLAILGALLCWSSSARADGIDIPWFLTRVGGWKHSPFRATVLILALIVADYMLNTLVIVLPSWKSGVSLRRASVDMIGFTLIAQLLDRAGMVAYSLAAYVLAAYGRPNVSLGFVLVRVLGASFLTSGLLIGIMTRYYCNRRWGLPKRRSLMIAMLAAIFTNPAWAIGAAFIPGFAE